MSEEKMNMFYGADVMVFENAKKLRENMTGAERKLFERLSKNELGVRFRAQHPLSLYVVDFYCHRAKLVIEIDGDIHFHEEAQKEDDKRKKAIEDFGLKDTRFTNEEVYKNMEGVISEINKHTKERLPQSPL
jgi:cyclase